MPMECRPFILSKESSKVFLKVYLEMCAEIIFLMSAGLNGFKICPFIPDALNLRFSSCNVEAVSAMIGTVLK